MGGYFHQDGYCNDGAAPIGAGPGGVADFEVTLHVRADFVGGSSSRVSVPERLIERN